MREKIQLTESSTSENVRVMVSFFPFSIETAFILRSLFEILRSCIGVNPPFNITRFEIPRIPWLEFPYLG